MASERLVTQAKSALLQHYQARPHVGYPRAPPNAEVASAYDEEREAAYAWSHQFVQLLADYDSTVGGSSWRDAEVKAWTGLVDGETRDSSHEDGHGRGGVQDPVPPSDRAAPSLVRTNSEDSESSESSESSEDEGWEDMNRYMAVPNWDYLVDTIHRVERSAATGEIMVYFTSRHGEKIKETGRLCKARLPKKLLAFYEENLRWDNDVVNGHY